VAQGNPREGTLLTLGLKTGNVHGHAESSRTGTGFSNLLSSFFVFFEPRLYGMDGANTGEEVCTINVAVAYILADCSVQDGPPDPELGAIVTRVKCRF
jgi:hypothetical protein